MTALGVVCDERAALDAELEAMAALHGVTRRYVVSYLGEPTVRLIARRAATAATGLDAGLLSAASRLDEEHPEAKGLHNAPEP
ncbi:MAG TPA: hypothetical protein VMU63_04720 [Acidimicrobiales bacterium]|nr:hypothetical protein [Acidimicrobiales bacterium]